MRTTRPSPIGTRGTRDHGDERDGWSFQSRRVFRGPGHSVHAGQLRSAVPQFGGYDATAGASLGFAILSDHRSVLPSSLPLKATNAVTSCRPRRSRCFNGQQAMVSDTSQSPFVVSVVPVVGDFAAAQQPVIVVLNEGTFMTVQAVVSDDRRFVRLTVVPVFSTIGEVNTFQFTGSTTTTESSEADGIQGRSERQHEHVVVVQLVDHLGYDGPVADVLLHHGDNHSQCAGRRHGSARRHQAVERGTQRVRCADAQQASLREPPCSRTWASAVKPKAS